jgi:phage repressor protein C with HTH and peptisase S24 domain
MYSDFIKEHEISVHDRIRATIDQEAKFRDYLPVYSLKAAAGKFGVGSDVHEEGWIAVNICKKLGKDMFVAKVEGHSMEPLIPNGSYCVFDAKVLGTRQGKIVLVQHHDINDIDTRSSYTVKKYRSKKQFNDDGTWQHEKIILESLNKDYKPIILLHQPEDEFKVIAEFVVVV